MPLCGLKKVWPTRATANACQRAWTAAQEESGSTSKTVKFDNIANIAQSAGTMTYNVNGPTWSGLCIWESTTESSKGVICFT